MTNIVIQQIANATRQLLSLSYSSNIDKISKNIKKAMGIEISYTDSTSYDGCIKWNNSLKRPEIVISKNDSYYRQKFTIAHELGHLILHWKWYPGNDLASKKNLKHNDILDTYHPTMFRNLVDIGRPKEREANEFAADLLMPIDSVQQIYEDSLSSNLDYVKYGVSNKFGVSTDAAYHRLKNLKKRNEL